MITVINLNSKKTKSDLITFKEKEYNVNVRIYNVHLRKINRIVGFNLFSKNDLYVGGETLYAAMQPKGSDVHHNYHDLTPEDILKALRSITNPYCVLKNGQDKVSIITSFISHLGKPINIIIEIGDGLRGMNDANINKMVTLFPISRVEKHIEKVGINNIYYIRIGNKAKQKA